MVKHCLLTACMAAVMLACSPGRQAKGEDNLSYEALKQRIDSIITGKPGQFGITIIVDGRDTVTVNNSDDYPLMSMFKLHEAIGVCHMLDTIGVGLDSVMAIDRAQLDPDTWSPMLKEHGSQIISLPIGRLIDYTLIDSDNNASNLLFDSIASVAYADSLVDALIPGRGFRLIWRESDMKADHQRAYDNVTSPLAYASLVSRVFNDSIMSEEKQNHIKNAMLRCNTGMSRLAAPLASEKGVTFGHRTGSGYVNERGEIVAVNDGGFVTLPSGKSYAIVVLVKDYAGPQEDAEAVMAGISKAVYDYITK